MKPPRDSAGPVLEGKQAHNREEAAGSGVLTEHLPHDPDTFGPSLYIHIPFCARKCYYCDFTAYFHRDERAARYVAHLIREMELVGKDPEVAATRFKTVFFGGGTPSLLTPEQLKTILGHLGRSFSIASDAEISMEANPGGLDHRRLAAMRAGGVNRLSIGAQAYQPAILAALGRDHGWDDVEAAVRGAREAGFDNINIDLMFGLPGQTTGDWEESLKAALSLEPRHISAYGLEIEPHTSYGRWYKEGRITLPPEETQATMMTFLRDFLIDRGFDHYELFNFARPGYRCRHNLNYWADGRYLGLGAGAWSSWCGRRHGNLRYLRTYGEAVEAGRWPIGDIDEPAPRVRMAETILLGTRLVTGMPRTWFKARHGRDAAGVFRREIDEMESRGLLELDSERLRLTPEGRLLADEVWMSFL